MAFGTSHLPPGTSLPAQVSSLFMPWSPLCVTPSPLLTGRAGNGVGETVSDLPVRGCRRWPQVRRFDRQPHRGGGPARGGRGDELVLAVGEAGLEVLLDRLASRDDVPGAVGLLGLEQVSQPALIDR